MRKKYFENKAIRKKTGNEEMQSSVDDQGILNLPSQRELRVLWQLVP